MLYPSFCTFMKVHSLTVVTFSLYTYTILYIYSYIYIYFMFIEKFTWQRVLYWPTRRHHWPRNYASVRLKGKERQWKPTSFCTCSKGMPFVHQTWVVGCSLRAAFLLCLFIIENAKNCHFGRFWAVHKATDMHFYFYESNAVGVFSATSTVKKKKKKKALQS